MKYGINYGYSNGSRSLHMCCSLAGEGVHEDILADGKVGGDTEACSHRISECQNAVACCCNCRHSPV